MPASSLTEQRIREIIREELQEVWDLEHVAREAASHAIDSLLHRLDCRDRQWQQEFVPHAVEIGNFILGYSKIAPGHARCHWRGLCGPFTY